MEIDKPKPRRRFTTCFVIIVISFCLLIAALFFVRMIIRSQKSTSQLALLHTYDTEIVELPASWYKPIALPSAEAVKAQEHLLSATSLFINGSDYSAFMERDAGYVIHWNLYNQIPLADSLKPLLAKFLTAVDPLIDEASRTASMPDYSIETGTYRNYSDAASELPELSYFASIASLASAARGDYHRAFNLQISMLRLLKRPAQAAADTHYHCMDSLSADTMPALSMIAEHCTATVELQRTLDAMTELQDKVFPGDPRLWKYGSSFGGLCRIAADGYPVELHPQSAGAALAQHNAILHKSSYYEWLIANLPVGDVRHVNAQKMLDVFNKRSLGYTIPEVDWISEEAMISGLRGFSTAAIQWKKISSEMEPTEKLGIYNLAIYNLVRLQLAQRIAELNDGETSSTAAPDLSAYIPGIPNDPYSRGFLRYSGELKKYYSIGPDRVDDHCKIAYDMENGEYGVGDIWLLESTF